jgi:hypothetical protein
MLPDRRADVKRRLRRDASSRATGLRPIRIATETARPRRCARAGGVPETGPGQSVWATKKAETRVSAWEKNWRQPTLAESIKPLPSARLCLTAVFGMGTGRTTALWPPKNGSRDRGQPRDEPGAVALDSGTDLADPTSQRASSLKTAHRRSVGITCSRVEIADPSPAPKPLEISNAVERRSDQAARPISISPLNGLLRLHA